MRRRAGQARHLAVTRSVPAEVGSGRAGAQRRRRVAARLGLLRLRPALLEELDLVLNLVHDGPHVALSELKLLHHLARHRVRAVRVRVEGELNRAGVTRGVANLEAEPERLILEDTTLDPEVERSTLLPHLPDITLLNRLRREVNLAGRTRHRRRPSQPAPAGVLLAAAAAVLTRRVDGRRRRGGRGGRRRIPLVRRAGGWSGRRCIPTARLFLRRRGHRVGVRRHGLGSDASVTLVLAGGRGRLRPRVRSHARQPLAPLTRRSRVVRRIVPSVAALMRVASLAAGFAARGSLPPPGPLIFPPRVGARFTRVESHVAHRRRALGSRRGVGLWVLHGELLRAAGPGRLRLLLDGWLGLGLRLDGRLVQERVRHQLLRVESLADGGDALQDERSEIRVDDLVQRLGLDTLGDALEDLRWVSAFAVRTLVRDQLDDAHAERVDVHALVVVLVVELGRHELRGANHRLGPVVVQHGGQSEVPDLHLALVLVDEDVVALQVAVHDGRVVRVEVVQAPQDLP